MKIAKAFYTADELSSTEYHEDKTYISSSVVKDALSDISYYHKKHVTRELVGKEKSDALDKGTYLHTAILEPEKLDLECAVYTGKTRKGAEWDGFKTLHSGKTIITHEAKESVQIAIDAARDNELIMQLVQSGWHEFSAFHTAFKMGFKVKARADVIGHGFIMDLKSTSANCLDSYALMNAIEDFGYDLSAAFYLDIFYDLLLTCPTAPEIKPPTDWYWGFASTKYGNSKLVKASEEMLRVGRMKYMTALSNIFEAKKNKWVLPPTMEELGPLSWVRDLWLKGQDRQKTSYKPAPSLRRAKEGELL